LFLELAFPGTPAHSSVPQLAGSSALPDRSIIRLDAIAQAVLARASNAVSLRKRAFSFHGSPHFGTGACLGPTCVETQKHEGFLSNVTQQDWTAMKQLAVSYVP
jgi:hypothetical protein